MEYYFDPDDKLNRLRYAEFLKSMLLNYEKYRREDGEGSYVIAIDSPWGTGKTRFVKMLRNYLEGRKPKLSAGKVNRAVVPKPDSKREFNVIYYNSWEVDYWTNAIEPLISNIINSDVFKEFREDVQNKELWNQFKDFAKGVLEASIDVAAEFSIWGKILNILIHGAKKTRERVNKPFEEFDKRKKLYSDFAESLSKIISKTDRKLVIIVDELDRCRPTFAIQTLELAKHLFAVKGLSFIFALDIRQLSSSIKTVYGIQMESVGYLCRFFEYVGNIPFPNKREYIKILLDQYNLTPTIAKLGRFYTGKEDSLESFIRFSSKIAINGNLSYRDLSTVFHSFRMLLDLYLGKYKYLEAICLYFLLLSVKYKSPSKYSELVTENGVNELTSSIKRIIDIPMDQVLLKQLRFLNSKEPLSSSVSTVYLHGQVGIEQLVSHGLGESSEIFEPESEFIIKKFQIPIHVREELFMSLIEGGCDVSINLTLFVQDLMRWDEIKHLTPMQYYHQQLEMFNFALPADEPATQS